MTQRVTIEGETWELMKPGEVVRITNGSPIISLDLDKRFFCFRKVEPPKEKESEKLFSEYKASCANKNYRVDDHLESLFLNAILALVREELPEMMKELGE